MLKTWTELKSLSAIKNASMQFEEQVEQYLIWFNDGSTKYECYVALADPVPNPSDQKDFEDNYKSACNKSTDVVVNPLAASTISFCGGSVKGAVPYGTTANIDYKIETVAKIITGGMIFTENAAYGDYVECQAIDIDNILGYGANFVLGTWIERWYITPGLPITIEQKQGDEMMVGLYLRMKYTSVGTTDVTAYINYILSRK